MSVSGLKSGSPPQLDDAQRDAVGVQLFLVGVLEELGGDRLGIDPGGREVVPLVAQDADELGGQRFVEDLDDPLTVGAVRVGDRALLDLGSSALAQSLYVGEEVSHAPLLPR